MHIWTRSFMREGPMCAALPQTFSQTQLDCPHTKQQKSRDTHKGRGIQGHRVTSEIAMVLKNVSEAELGSGT